MASLPPVRTEHDRIFRGEKLFTPLKNKRRTSMKVHKVQLTEVRTDGNDVGGIGTEAVFGDNELEVRVVLA